VLSPSVGPETPEPRSDPERFTFVSILVVILVEFIFSAPFLNATRQPFAHVLGSSYELRYLEKVLRAEMGTRAHLPAFSA
jgi:hypothetical protein